MGWLIRPGDRSTVPTVDYEVVAMQPKQQIILIIFTQHYPNHEWGDGWFLPEEMAYLSEAFPRVIVVPRRRLIRRQPVPRNVIVDDTFALQYNTGPKGIRGLCQALRSPLFYADVCAHPSFFMHFGVLRRLVRTVTGATATREWTVNFIRTAALDLRHTLFYTFWMDNVTLGLAQTKQACPKIRLISRAHNANFYAEAHKPPYIPCRRATLSLLDGVYLVSADGKRYLTERYPEYRHILHVARLGTKDPGFMTPSSTDGVLRIVSCSSLKPVKRVHLLVTGLGCAARRQPNRRIEWHHIGGGPLMADTMQMTRTLLPSNVRSYLWDYLPHTDVLGFYKAHAVDIFVNVSASEDVPVSIMEAASCGIPVAATRVGGTSELVSSDTGWLLPSHPTEANIADALLEAGGESDTNEGKRKASRAAWERICVAGVNYPAFIERLWAVMERRNAAETV